MPVDSDSVDLHLESTDVLIAGSGAAGMRAAIAAHDAGQRVVVLAKGPHRANHTRMSGGRYNTVSGLNPQDSPDAFFQDTLESGAYINNHELARILAYEAMDRAYDLEDYGLTWDRKEATRYNLSMTGGGTYVRTIGSTDEGIGITEVMVHQLHKRGVRICDFHMLAEVVQNDKGEVTGGLVLDLARGCWRYIACKSLVIATGGTSQLYETSSGPAINTGDGIGIALRAGAEMVDIEFMQFIPISFVYPPSIRGYTLTEPAHYGMRHYDPKADAAHLLNTQGERFVLKHDPVRKEGSTRDVLARAIMLEILEGRGTPEGGVLMVPDPQVFDHFLHERPIYVKRLLENYGEPQARFEAPIQVMPSALYTLGGVKIDPWCRSAVPGLYAAGEAAGGVHGANRLGGSSMPDIQVFGRRAGVAAAGYAEGRGLDQNEGLDAARRAAGRLESALQPGEGIRPIEVKKRIQKLMWDDVGLVRNGPKLEAALDVFANLRREVMPRVRVTSRHRVLNREWMEALELENMLDVAELMATAALHRRETRGAHYRQDHPDIDPAWQRNICIRRVGQVFEVRTQEVDTTLAPKPATQSSLVPAQ
ncbi:fumarate reductase subunit A [Agaricicola taiwanensis]|uniref:Fumarate reductase subunit A n=1 Tax=Agaricicola taiwanensis TaxID=591372 RepID=A0A8J2YCR5_9RHOB|nr:FAD-binding protein [Agaricicola taiwanensis]GGE37919.1 fumarate reductase subunit A [Agaricicola taiwanensis]